MHIVILFMDRLYMKRRIGKARGIYIPDELMEWLKESASSERRSVSSFIAILIEKEKGKRNKKTK